MIPVVDPRFSVVIDSLHDKIMKKAEDARAIEQKKYNRKLEESILAEQTKQRLAYKENLEALALKYFNIPKTTFSMLTEEELMSLEKDITGRAIRKAKLKKLATTASAISFISSIVGLCFGISLQSSWIVFPSFMSMFATAAWLVHCVLYIDSDESFKLVNVAKYLGKLPDKKEIKKLTENIAKS